MIRLKINNYHVKSQVESLYYSGDIGRKSRRPPLAPLLGCEMSKNPDLDRVNAEFSN